MKKVVERFNKAAPKIALLLLIILLVLVIILTYRSFLNKEDVDAESTAISVSKCVVPVSDVMVFVPEENEVTEETEEINDEEVSEESWEVVVEESEEDSDSDSSDLEYLGTFEVTAYEWTGNPCANGNYPTEGYTVACNSLPLGTELYLEGIGYRVVEDRGADWHSYDWLDLYLGDVDACYEWGVRSIEVYVVKH